MNFFGYLFVIFFVGLIITLLIVKGILFYNRNLRTYKIEIREWLQTQQFELVDTRFPTTKDWINGPFVKPSSVSSPIDYIPDSGMKYKDKDYIVIIGKNQKGYREFWLEIESEMGSKPILNFRTGKVIEPNEIRTKKDNVRYIKVHDVCPACSCKLEGNEKECPDCGLYFE
jgi:hypothetical protein